MVNITASELNKRTGLYLQTAMREPVVIEKSGNPSVVMVSYEDYIELEDDYWGKRAEEIKKTEEFFSPEESMAFLLKGLEKK